MSWPARNEGGNGGYPPQGHPGQYGHQQPPRPPYGQPYQGHPQHFQQQSQAHHPHGYQGHHPRPGHQQHVPVEGLPHGWTRAPGWALPGEPGTLTARPVGDVGTYLRYLLAFSPLLGVFFLVVLILTSIFFETASPGTGVTGGIVVGALATLCLAVLPVVRTRRMLGGTVVVISPAGVDLRDHIGFEVRLRWRDATQVGRTVDRVAAGPGVEVGGQQVQVRDLESRGLVGWGERVIPDQAARMRTVLASQPRHPRTGAELVAVSFQAAGASGWDNPLVTEARRHRPDLFG
ncbi:hypothetical protein [Nocardiopsis eucommiae]|uniref:hypothetical protein n=1 Tax=Nocardiopsis eucommiae TaxID=2831970 RepID=UPI003D75F870